MVLRYGELYNSIYNIEHIELGFKILIYKFIRELDVFNIVYHNIYLLFL